MEVVTNIAALTALTNRPRDVYVAGYTTANDGGGGFFRWFGADANTAVQGMIVSPSAGVAGRYKRMIPENKVHTKWFGAFGDGTTADDTAIVAWWDWIAANRHGGHIDSGHYRLTSQKTWNLGVNTTLAGRGITITTDGPANSLFVFDAAVASPNLLITATGATTTAIYARFQGIGVFGNVNGKILQIMDTNLTSSLNNSELSFLVNNSNTSSSTVGMEINYAVGCSGTIVAGCGANNQGAALQMKQSLYGNYNIRCITALRGLYLTGPGFNYGNEFRTPSLANLGVGLKVDSANTYQNVFYGGIIDGVGYAFEMTNGNAAAPNRWITPVLGTFSSDTFNLTGSPTHNLLLEGPNTTEVTTPAVPASTVTATNVYGERVQVFINGGTVTAVSHNAGTIFTQTNCSVILNPGDTIAVTYSVAPSWNWRRIL